MYQKSDIQILVSTMNRTDFDFLKAMFVASDFSDFTILVINQTTPDKQLVSNFDQVTVVNSFDKGLSKSRNLALQNATKPLVVFTDDDVVFASNFDAFILKAFIDYPNFDGFRFPFQIKEGEMSKKYPNTFQSKLTSFAVLNTSSVELVFKKEAIQSARLHFDENFGLNAHFSMGEEAVFVSDALKKGLKIGFVPQVLLTHPQPTTSQKTTDFDRYFQQSAVFYRIFGKMYLFWVALKLLFDLKQGKIAFRAIPQFVSQALKGKKAYVDSTAL